MYKTKNDFLNSLENELGRVGIMDKNEIIADFKQHFEESGAQGLSEAEICQKLGDISEIAKHYAEDEIYPAVLVVEPKKSGQAEGATPYENSGIKFDFTKNAKQSSDYENSGIKLNFAKNNGGGNYYNNNADGNYYNNNANNYNNANNGGGGNNYRNNYSNNNINVGGLIAVICVDIFVLSWAIPALFGTFIGLLSIPFAFVVSGLASIVVGIFGSVWWISSPFSGLLAVFIGFMALSLGGLLTLAGVQLVKLFIKIIKALIDWHGNMIVGRPVFKKKTTGNPTEEASA